MRVVAFNGSARKGGNTEQLIQITFNELEEEGIETMKDLGRNMAWLIKKISND